MSAQGIRYSSHHKIVELALHTAPRYEHIIKLVAPTATYRRTFAADLLQMQQRAFVETTHDCIPGQSTQVRLADQLTK
jgi:hypothetical protein